MSLPQIAPTSTAGPAIRVMIVDDAVVVRGLMSRWLSEESGVEIVGTFRNGREAVDNVLKLKPDVVVLDIDMPELDGLSALPLLLARKPDLVVIMASTLTRRNAEVSLKALSLGAIDYVTKPETSREIMFAQSFRREIVEKIRHLGRRRAPALLGPKALREAGDPHAQATSLRAFSSVSPRLLAIGSSTGGPQALQVMIRGLAPVLGRLPVVITQHMPPTFTAILAEHLGRAANRPAHEGVHGETIKPGMLYVAPGGKHMRLTRQGGYGRDRARRRSARAFLQARGRSAVSIGGGGLRLGPARGRAHGYGHRRHGGRARRRLGRRQHHRAGRSVERGVGHAGLGRA